MIYTAFVALSPVLVANAMVFQELLSFEPPLTEDKFDHWDAEGSTVFLTNKILLAPEGKDQTGYLAQQYVSFCFCHDCRTLNPKSGKLNSTWK
jgi:hypothetical protein